MSTIGRAVAEDLTPYVPRLALEWELDGGDAAWRELDGSLLFLDISGFTKMSERLARFGKLGAEEVTETLNATFARLLDVAYSQGGSLLKFGGDALLLWFSGDEHPQRAAATAFDLRAELRSIGRARTSAGFVQLRMSVGVHTGRFHFFLCGRSHRELVVTGPGVTETVSMEHDASAGDILLSPALAASLEPTCIGPPKGPGHLLRRRPAPSVAGVALRRDGTASPERFTPTALRSHVALGGQGAEHRQVAIAFVHYDGVDERLRSGDVEGVAVALDHLVRSCQAAADELDLGFIGTDVDADGGKVILVAGAPRSIDLQEEAILRAGRRILDDLPEGLTVRIGAHRGHVFAGDVGTPYRRTYTVMGDAVNTAARVMAKAAPGELLATPDVSGRSSVPFELEPLEPFKVKGKAKPLQAARVGAPRSARAAAPTVGELPLVGRSDVLAQLQAVVASAGGGAGGVVELVADAGMGKTRIVEELRTRAQGLAWLTTTCEQYERSTPYFAMRALLLAVLGVDADAGEAEVVDRLRTVVRERAPEIEPWLPLLAVPLDVIVPPTDQVDQLDPGQRRRRTNRVALDLVAAVVPGPAVWVVDDAHWLDESSIAFVELVAASIATRPWVIVLARWPGDRLVGADVGGASEVRLEPLSTDAAVELARVAADGAMLPHDAFLVAERAGGSPLFVKELARTLARGESDEQALPETVEALIATRIDALPPRDRALLQTAAVLGRRGRRQILEQVLEDLEASEGRPQLRPLDGFLTVDEEGFRFDHGLVREVAYERLPYRRRRALHLRAATAVTATLGEAAEPELLSLHYHQGGDHAAAWHHSARAARRAQSKHAFADAVTFWRRALEVARRLPEVDPQELVTAWIELGDALMRSGRLDDAPTAYAAARRLVTDPSLEGRLCLLEGEARRALGRPVAALRWYRRGLRAVQVARTPDDAKNRVRLQLGCAFIEYHRGEYQEAMRAANRARSEAQAADDLGGLGHSCNLLLLAGTAIGDPACAQYGRQALDAFTRAGIRMLQGEVLCNLGELARVAGRWDEAVDHFARAREALVESGEVVGTAVVEHNLAEILSDQGRLDEAKALMESALATFRGARHQYTPFAQSQLGRLVARAGDFSAAATLLGDAAEQLRSLGVASEAARAQAFDAERLLFAGEHEAAAASAADLLVSAPAQIRPLVHRIQGCALAELGHAADARVALLEGLRLATASGETFERALLLGALAWVAAADGHEDEAAAYEAESSATMAALGVTGAAIHRVVADA